MNEEKKVYEKCSKCNKEKEVSWTYVPGFEEYFYLCDDCKNKI